MKISKTVSVILIIILLTAAAVSGLADVPEVPELDSLYQSQRVRLNGFSDQDTRVFAWYGPGRDYLSAHGYKPFKQKKITAYFNEGGWVLVHLQYQTARERYLYLPDNAFTSLAGVKEVYEMEYYEGVTLSGAPVRIGPGEEFISEDGLRSIPAGTGVKVFFQKNGYMYAEFMAGATPVRMWIPAEDVEITSAGIYVPEQRERLRATDTELSSAGNTENGCVWYACGTR